jgi:hypothetical protein
MSCSRSPTRQNSTPPHGQDTTPSTEEQEWLLQTTSECGSKSGKERPSGKPIDLPDTHSNLKTGQSKEQTTPSSLKPVNRSLNRGRQPQHHPTTPTTHPINHNRCPSKQCSHHKPQGDCHLKSPERRKTTISSATTKKTKKGPKESQSGSKATPPLLSMETEAKPSTSWQNSEGTCTSITTPPSLETQ